MGLLRKHFKKLQCLPLFLLTWASFTHSGSSLGPIRECCPHRSLPGHPTVPRTGCSTRKAEVRHLGLAMDCRAPSVLCIRSRTVTALPIASPLAPSADLHSLGSTRSNMHLRHTGIRSATLFCRLSLLHSAGQAEVETQE